MWDGQVTNGISGMVIPEREFLWLYQSLWIDDHGTEKTKIGLAAGTWGSLTFFLVMRCDEANMIP